VPVESSAFGEGNRDRDGGGCGGLRCHGCLRGCSPASSVLPGEGRARLRAVHRARRFGGAGPTAADAAGRRAHDIDFVIHGNEMQFVEVELDPGEAAVAEAGVFMYMTPGIQMETILATAARRRRACSTRCSGPASAF